VIGRMLPLSPCPPTTTTTTTTTTTGHQVSCWWSRAAVWIPND
jgi:hypothetical protein